LSEAVATVEEALRQGASLLEGAGIEQPRHEARLLLGHVMGLTRERLLLCHRSEMDQPVLNHLIALVRRRAAREPIAYLIGEREFWGLSFEVTRDTLIPRPDSETLIEAALQFANRTGQERPRILDFGTGSGCLLVSLLTEMPFAQGFGVDHSFAALRIAQRNAMRHDVAARAHFLVGSWGEALAPPFDLIIANPPYVALGERAAMMPDVKNYEPSQALFAGARGDEAYSALAPDFCRLLSPAGRVFVEFGAGSADRAAAIFQRVGLSECERRKDLAGIERCGIFQRVGT